MKVLLLIKSHFLSLVITARLSGWGQKSRCIIEPLVQKLSIRAPQGEPKRRRTKPAISIYSTCQYSCPSAKTLLDYQNHTKQVKGPLRPIRNEWPRTDGLCMCLQYLQGSRTGFLSAGSAEPHKRAKPVRNQTLSFFFFSFCWKASSLFWWYPHSSFLCDQITTAHYPPSTGPGFISYQPMVKALVDSAACIPGSRLGPVVGVILKKKGEGRWGEPAFYWWMGPPGCFSWSFTGQLTPSSQVQVQRGHCKSSSSRKKC